MMSDAIPSGKASYSGFTLVLDSQQVEEGKRWFDNLAANGKIEMAWQETSGRMASAKSPINLAYRG